jgi:hypothetical protein
MASAPFGRTWHWSPVTFTLERMADALFTLGLGLLFGSVTALPALLWKRAPRPRILLVLGIPLGALAVVKLFLGHAVAVANVETIGPVIAGGVFVWLVNIWWKTRQERPPAGQSNAL